MAVLTFGLLFFNNLSAHVIEESQISNIVIEKTDLTNSLYSPVLPKKKFSVTLEVTYKDGKWEVKVVVRFSAAPQEESPLGDNKFLAEGYLENDNLILIPIGEISENIKLTIPSNFELPKDVSLRLGSRSPIILRGTEKPVQITTHTPVSFQVQKQSVRKPYLGRDRGYKNISKPKPSAPTPTRKLRTLFPNF